MQPDGSYVKEPGEENTSSQERLYRYFHDRKVEKTLPAAEEAPEPKKKKGFFARLAAFFRGD